MRLTIDEFKRGLVTWSPRPGLHVRVGTKTNSADELVWSAPMDNADGSVVEIETKPLMAVALTGFQQAAKAGFWVKVERDVDGVVRTAIWNEDLQGPVSLKHLPGTGTYHRLVIDAGTFDWNDDSVFRVGGLLVRFINGKIEGEARGTLKPFSKEDGTFGFQGMQETQTLSGRFVEIVAPGDSADVAEALAYGVLGLLALTLGQNLLGTILFSEPWLAVTGKQEGAAIVPGREFPRKAAAAEFASLDGLLGRVIHNGRIERARLVALRWYERGFRTEDPTDMLLSCYVGIEALVAALAKDEGPIPPELARQHENDAVVASLKGFAKAVRDRVSFRLRGASMREQFVYYGDRRLLPDDLVDEFVELKGLRDSIVHGDHVVIDINRARRAERLLRAMLKAEFGIAGQLPWEPNGAILQVRVEFSLEHH